MVALPFDADKQDQQMVLNIAPNGTSRSFRVRLKYRDYVGRYYMSVYDANTGEGILVNFPLVASQEDAFNDLMKQISYKLTGSVFCVPVVRELTYPDPSGTLNEFEVVWGDTVWQS